MLHKSVLLLGQTEMALPNVTQAAMYTRKAYNFTDKVECHLRCTYCTHLPQNLSVAV